MTMQVIQHIELGSAQSSISFTSIAGTFTDLLLVTSLRSSRSDSVAFSTAQVQFNGVSTNRSRRSLYNVDGTVGSDSGSDFWVMANSNSTTSNTFSNSAVYIPNYTASTAKSLSADIVTENNATAVYGVITAGLWNSTAAITQIDILGSGHNLLAGSSATLYGITKGSDGTTTVS